MTHLLVELLNIVQQRFPSDANHHGEIAGRLYDLARMMPGVTDRTKVGLCIYPELRLVNLKELNVFPESGSLEFSTEPLDTREVEFITTKLSCEFGVYHLYTGYDVPTDTIFIKDRWP